jgi:iron(III) transport system ATP-binding protein
VVLRDGRVEQAGTPEDIYGHPRTEFVARFVGGANVLPGHFAGLDAPFSIRLEDVGLTAAPAPHGIAAVDGTVVRRVFLGSARDYVVEAGGELIRVTTPPQTDIQPGERVWLAFPPERCHRLEPATAGGA